MYRLKSVLFTALLFGIFLGTGGCEKPEIPKPDNLITEDTYIDLLAEMQLVRVWHSSAPDSINADSLMQEVYNKYQISEEQFQNSHLYYEQFIREQQDRISEAIKRLEGELGKLESQDVKPDSAASPSDSLDTL